MPSIRSGRDSSTFRYIAEDKDLAAGLEQDGPFRQLSIAGRTGLHATSRHSRLKIPGHTVNEDRGSLTMWVCALEDLVGMCSPAIVEPYDRMYRRYTLLSDSTVLGDYAMACFSLVFRPGWASRLFAEFFRGTNAYHPLRGRVLCDSVEFRQGQWVQVGLSWDRSGSDYRLYVNGILVGTSTQFGEMEHHPCGDTLYAGNPALVLSDLAFFDRALSGADFAAAFEEEAVSIDPQVQQALRKMHIGKDLPVFDWQPGDDWTLALDSALNGSEDLDLFYVQGCREAPSITDEGLLVETRMTRTPEAVGMFSTRPPREHYDPDQVYLWTHQSFEGDLAVEYEFMPLKENGLSLLMVQATGMQREDFLADYPLRRWGSMHMVCWENVRNYHWEYFREMDDTRHDTISHIVTKNPWGRQMAYQCQPGRWAHDVWHKLQFVQQGQRLRGAIDNVLLFDVEDDPFTGNGPTLNAGHIAIRCMWKTRLLLRNLRVYNRWDAV